MFRRLGLALSIATFSALFTAGFVNAPIASALTTSSISGTVTFSSAGVAGVCITAEAETSGAIATATTAGDGTYTVSGLAPDSYVVFFDPSCGGSIASTYAWQYYNGTALPEDAGTVAVTSGVSIPGVNASLALGSQITGAVTANGGTAVSNVCILFYAASSNILVSETTSGSGTGTYDRTSFPTGDYFVRFDPTCEGDQTSPYAIQYYANEPDIGVASSVNINTTGSVRSGISAALVPGGSISGTITAPGASNSFNICVSAYGGTGGYFESLAGTNVSGQYDITNLPADTYKVLVDPTCDGLEVSDFNTDWFPGVSDFNQGTTLSLGVSQSVTGISETVGASSTPLSISNSALPAGSTAAGYSATAVAAGGVAPYSWSATGLPPGLSINASTGAISGTPTAGGNYTVTVTVTDAATQPLVTSGTFSIVVSQPAAVTTTTTTTVPTRTERVCTDKTKTETVRKLEVKNGKKVTVVTHKKVKVYKTVAVRKIEKVKGKKVVVVTHKKEVVQVCKTVVV